MVGKGLNLMVKKILFLRNCLLIFKSREWTLLEPCFPFFFFSFVELSLISSPLCGAIRGNIRIITPYFIQISELPSSSCVLQSRLVQVTALSPRLEQLSAETGSLGAVPSLKDNMVVVSAHHASTLQRIQSREQEVNKGIFVERYKNNLLNQRRGNFLLNPKQIRQL